VADPTRTEPVTVDGGTMDLHLWVPDEGSGPGVLLPPEIFGVGPYIRAVGRRLARTGYVAAAPQVFWRIAPGWAAEHDQEGMEASMGLVSRLDWPQAVADCVAALDHLRSVDEVRGSTGVLGFCMGGTLAYLVGAEADPDAVVSYYGTGVAENLDRLADVACPVLFHFGGQDAFLGPDAVDRVQAAVEASGRDDVEVVVQPGAGHAFDNHEAPMFHDPDAAAAAWAVTERFLAQRLPIH
jgi:carboxymethylenebutenolidase